MKRKYIAVLLALVLLFTCSGCALFEKEYIYSEPYVGSLDQDTGNATEVRNYSMLKAAILAMINGHQETGEFRFSSYNGNVSDDLAAVCLEIKSANPLGAYAVDSISYDSSRIISYYIAEISISYKKSADAIQSIRNINTIAELKTYLHDEVLSPSLPMTTIRPYISSMDAETLTKLIEEISFDDPVGIPLPVTAEITDFPPEGSSSIFEISLNYMLSSGIREIMTEKMTSRIHELTAGSLPEDNAECALALAETLDRELTDSDADYVSTAYGALVERSADSRGIALAYRALCAAADLPCIVVRGNIGAMGTEEHFWNIIQLDDDYYHVDVSQFPFDPAYAFLLSDDDLWGTYIWNTEDYPACSGALRYADVAPQEEEPAEPVESEPPVTGAPDEPAPEETAEPQPEPTPEIKPEESENLP